MERRMEGRRAYDTLEGPLRHYVRNYLLKNALRELEDIQKEESRVLRIRQSFIDKLEKEKEGTLRFVSHVFSDPVRFGVRKSGHMGKRGKQPKQATTKVPAWLMSMVDQLDSFDESIESQHQLYNTSMDFFKEKKREIALSVRSMQLQQPTQRTLVSRVE